MPLERPLREPIIGPDGQMSRRWKDYFDSLDVGQGTSIEFETESRFQSGAVDYGSDVRRLRVTDALLRTDVNDLQARVKALEFLDT